MLRYVKLREMPELKEPAAEWFHRSGEYPKKPILNV